MFRTWTFAPLKFAVSLISTPHCDALMCRAIEVLANRRLKRKMQPQPVADTSATASVVSGMPIV